MVVALFLADGGSVATGTPTAASLRTAVPRCPTGWAQLWCSSQLLAGVLRGVECSELLDDQVRRRWLHGDCARRRGLLGPDQGSAAYDDVTTYGSNPSSTSTRRSTSSCALGRWLSRSTSPSSGPCAARRSGGKLLPHPRPDRAGAGTRRAHAGGAGREAASLLELIAARPQSVRRRPQRRSEQELLGRRPRRERATCNEQLSHQISSEPPTSPASGHCSRRSARGNCSRSRQRPLQTWR